MANATTVTLTSGVPTAPSGTVSTLDNLIGTAGAASAQVQTVQGIASMTPLKVDGSGVTQPVSIASLPSGAVTNAGTFAVQNNAATPAGTNVIGHVIVDSAPTTAITAASLPLPAGAATSANQPTAAAIASTTSGQTGHIAMGAVTTAAPTYTTAQSNPLSLDTAGNLRVNVVTGGTSGAVAQGSTTSGQTGGLIQGAVTTAAPTYTTAQTSPLSLDTTGALRVNVTAGGAGGGIVTNAGTFAVQNNAATPAGTNVIGKVGINDGTSALVLSAASTGSPAATVVAVPVTIRDANTNGSAVSASSAPVVIASDQAAVAVKAANGSFASGSFASGAHAAGSIAAGAAVSGAFVAGAIADLAHGQAAMAASVPVVIASNQSSIPIAGDVASGSSNSGNPLQIGGIGLTANPTAVTTGQRVGAMFDKLGKQVVVGAIRTLKGVQDTTITASTSETTIVTAGAAGVFNDLYGLALANSSATATVVTIKDATAGTTRAVIAVPAGETRGLMLPVDSAIPQATAANNWTATSSASVTSLFVTALYVQNT